jgi:hypothetical protein
MFFAIDAQFDFLLHRGPFHTICKMVCGDTD